MNEVENAVLSGIRPGDERGPGDRALRWCRCAETPETAAIAKTAEVGQITPVPGDKFRVHAIDAENDDFSRGVGRMGLAAC